MKDTSSNSSAKKNAGYKAAEYVEDGMVLGLGTGSTTHFFIEKVGMRIKEEGINVMGIPTSFQSLLIAKEWNIPITTLEEHDIDLSVDGADEVDHDFNLIKGGGAAHTKEKIVDYAADKFIVIVDESKVVDELGNFPVPVEVERASIDLLTTSKSIFEGSTFTYNAPNCDENCDFHDLCFPEGLAENDKCIVLENHGKHKQECKKGYKLNKLTLGFVI